MGEGYIKSLDGVRAIAIILVMTFHFELNHFGWMGVQLFFVLSGFLITSILWKEKARKETVGFRLRKFWIRRSLRIFPLYFGFLFFLAISFLLFHFPVYYREYIPYLLTYTYNYTRTFPGWQGNPLFTHLWSLSIEEQFYLFFPLVVFLASPRFLKVFMVAVIVLSPLSRFLLGEYFRYRGFVLPVVADTVYWHTLSHLDAFFLGGLIPVLSLDNKVRRPQVLLVLFLVLAVVAGALSFFTSGTGSYLADLGYGHGKAAHYEYVWHYSLLNLLFASLILSLVSVHTPKAYRGLGKVLEHPWLVRIGRVSYGMYLFHWAILVYVYARFFTSGNPLIKIILFLPYLALVYFFAALSYKYYESTFIRLKDKFFPKRKAELRSPALLEEEKQ